MSPLAPPRPAPGTNPLRRWVGEREAADNPLRHWNSPGAAIYVPSVDPPPGLGTAPLGTSSLGG